MQLLEYACRAACLTMGRSAGARQGRRALATVYSTVNDSMEYKPVERWRGWRVLGDG